jgi:hypothetical protein
MTEQEIPKEFSVKGLLKKIVGYDAHSNSTSGPSEHSVCQTIISTRLEILTDDGKTLPIHFQSYVGYELVSKRVTYIADNEVTNADVSTAVGVRHAKQDVTRQKLIPDDDNLPKYLASNCVYQG